MFKQDEIIEMARQAGYDDIEQSGIYVFEDFDVKAFAKRIALRTLEGTYDEMIDIVRKAEREACAKFVDHILKEGGGTYGDAIRARGTEA